MNLNIAWFYSDLMSTYGDRGNIISLTYRVKKRNININLLKISVKESAELVLKSDLIFMGGAQDKQQEIVNKDLETNKGKNLKLMIEKGIPGLYVCGAYQFLGKYYKAADGTIIKGLDIFDLYTESPGIDAPRLIGNLIAKPDISPEGTFVGFENHTGRTYLGEKVKPFAKVVNGFGNNGEDKTEGMIYKNSIGTYMHGPILPKNPLLADWLIAKAIEIKYKKRINLENLDDSLENKAKEIIVKRYT